MLHSGWFGGILGVAFACAGCGESTTQAADDAAFLRPPASLAGKASASDVSSELSATSREGASAQPDPPGSELAPEHLGDRSEAATLVAQKEQEAATLLDSGDSVRAAAMYSNLALDALRREDAGTRARLQVYSAAIARAQHGHRWSKLGAWPAVDVEVQPGDSLTTLRKRVLASHPGLRTCTGLIARANQLPDERAIHPRERLRIPTDMVTLLVDVSARWVFYLHADQVVAAWQVGVGKPATPTRPGQYFVGTKQREPMWFVEGRKPVAYGDPANPLGTRWLGWHTSEGSTSLGFHGTNDEAGIGDALSDGCVRMRNVDVEELYEIAPEGAPVLVQP